MIYLLGHVIAGALFSLCYKIAETKVGCRTTTVLLNMCFGALVFALPLALYYEGLLLDWRVIGLGLINGVFLFVAIRTFFIAMTQGGLAIGWTFVNLSVVIPVIASIWFWREIPGRWQTAGLLLMIPCVLLFGDLHLSIKGNARRWLALVVIAS